MTTNRILTFVLLGLTLGGCTTAARRGDGGPSASLAAKPRVVVTADPELDDSNSLIRYLLYSTDFRTEGLVYASSQFHWKGDGTGKKFSVPNREYFRFGQKLCPCESWRWAPDERFIDDAVDIYERVYPNLRVHHPRLPHARRAAVEDPLGEHRVRRRLLEGHAGLRPHPRSAARRRSRARLPARVGRASTIARALKSIQDRYAAHGRVAGDPREGLAQGDPLALGRPGRHVRQLHPAELARHPHAARGAGRRRRSATARSCSRRAENAPYFSVGLDAGERVEPGAVRRALPRVGRRQADGEGRQVRLLRARRAHHRLAPKLGYVVWLPPRPKGEFLGEGDTFTYFNLIGNGLGAYRDETPGGWGGPLSISFVASKVQASSLFCLTARSSRTEPAPMLCREIRLVQKQVRSFARSRFAHKHSADDSHDARRTIGFPAIPSVVELPSQWVMASASGGANALWLIEWLAEAMDLRPNMRVLDLGCGLAASSVFLRHEFGVQVWPRTCGSVPRTTCSAFGMPTSTMACFRFTRMRGRCRSPRSSSTWSSASIRSSTMGRMTCI